MADEMERRDFEILGTLAPRDMLGNQIDEVRAMKSGELMLGTVLIEVRGLSYRHNKNDETIASVALAGPTKFYPASLDRPELWAQRCYLPGAVHDVIVASMEQGHKRPIDRSPTRKEKPIDVMFGATVQVVVEIGVIPKPETAIGYQYKAAISKKVQLALVDPLANLSKLAGLSTRALPAPGKASTKKR